MYLKNFERKIFWLKPWLQLVECLKEKLYVYPLENFLSTISTTSNNYVSNSQEFTADKEEKLLPRKLCLLMKKKLLTDSKEKLLDANDVGR